MQNKIGGMATIPQREDSLPKVIACLSKQVDDLFLYLNRYKKIPKILAKFPNVHPILGTNHYGDMNANGKMYFLKYVKPHSYCFTFDDDIVFPSDYVSYM